MSNRVGLARIRPLTIKPIKMRNSSGKDIPELPDGNYLNETREKEFWEQIEKYDNSKMDEKQADELKKTEQVTALQDTSGKIRALVRKFDDIDQETLMNLAAIYDQGASETLDEQSILNDSKRQVVDLISQLRVFSDSQSTLVENLKYWFNSLEKRSEESALDIGNVPNVNDVMQSLGQIVQEFAEKSERAECLHNDITDCLFKQFAQLKRVVATKNEDIKKLQKIIDDNNSAAERRKAKKREQGAKNEEGIKKEQLEAQIRQNQELKGQVEQLKKQLQDADVHRASMMAMGGVSGDPSKAMELQGTIASLKLENESMTKSFGMKVDDLNAQIAKLKQLLAEDEGKFKHYEEKLKKKEQRIEELDLQLQKALQQTIERVEKPLSSTPSKGNIEMVKNLQDEISLMQLKHSDEIKKIQSEFKNELKNQLDYQRAAFARERQQLVNSLGSQDQSNLIKSIQAACDKRIEELKLENEKIREDSLKQLSSKIALLTRQYEHRIKSLNQSHQGELDTLNSSVEFAKKQMQIDFEEKLQEEIQKITDAQETTNMDGRAYIEKLERAVKNKEEESRKLREALIEASKTGEVDPSALIVPEREPLERPESLILLDSATSNQSKIFTSKLKIAKEELEDQMNWQLGKQKEYYERKISENAIKQQHELRQSLMGLQEAVNNVKDIEDLQGITKIIDNIAKVFCDMNDQLNQIENQPKVPMVTVEDAGKRTKVLTDRIIDLRQQCQDLQSHGNDAELIESLKQQLLLAKNMTDGNQQKIFEQFDEIKNKYKEEIAKRDKIINEFQTLDFGAPPRIVVEMNWFKDVIFTKSSEHKEFPELVDVDAGQTPKQMMSMSTTPLQTNRIDRDDENVTSQLDFQSKTIVHMDTPITYKNNEDTVYVEPNGTQKVTKLDGTHIIIEPNGTQRIIQPNGTEITIDPNGTQYRKEPDGTHVTIEQSGNQFIVTPNGLQVTITADGHQEVVKPDGMHVSIENDGTQMFTNGEKKLSGKVKKGGNQFIEMDGAVITIDAAGVQFRKEADGSEITFDSNGSQFREYPDGTRATIAADGTQNIVKSDGTKVTIEKDGSQTIKKASGEQYIIDENGDTYQITAEGEQVRVDDTVIKPEKPIEKVDPFTPLQTVKKFSPRRRIDPYITQNNQFSPMKSPMKSPAKSGKRQFTFVHPVQSLSIFGNSFEYIERFDPIDILGTRPRSAAPEKVVVSHKTAEVQCEIQPKVVEKVVEKEVTKMIHSKSQLSISSENLSVNHEPIQDVNLKLSQEAFVTEEIKDPVLLHIPSAPQTYHVSPAYTPRGNLVVMMSFSGEKLESPPPPLTFITAQEVYMREPPQAVYPEVSPLVFYDKPIPDKKLVMALFDALERQEMKVEVLTTQKKQSSKESSESRFNSKESSEVRFNSKYAVQKNEIFNGVPYKIMIERSISDVIDFNIEEEKKVEPNVRLLYELRVAALERYEKIIANLKSDNEILHEQLARKPGLVVLQEKRDDDLKPPTFSNKTPLKNLGKQALGLPPEQKPKTNEFVVEEAPPPPPKPQEPEPIKEDKPQETNKLQKVSESTTSLEKLEKSSTHSSFVQDLTINGVDIQNDPFGSSHRILSTQLRSVKEFIENDQELFEKISSDTDAYYAYISATGVTDESHYDFINALKSSKEEHDDNHQQLFYIQNVGMMLSKCLTAMKQRYNALIDELKHAKEQQQSQESKIQEELLSNIVNASKDMSQSVNKLDLLHKLENSLNVVNELGLVKSDADEKEWENLMAKIEKFEDFLAKEMVINQNDLDQLSVSVQSFIGKLNSTNDSPTPKDDVEVMKKDLYRIRKQRSDFRKKFENERSKNEQLTIENQQLKDKLAELKENQSAEKTEAQAQLANLKEIVNITNSASPEDAKAIYSKQLLNMASMLDAANAEKNMLLAKLSDLEQSLATSHDRENKLQAEIGDLIENNLDLKHSNSSSILFKDADIEHLRGQLSADKEVNQKQRQQLEEATAQNALLIQSNAKLEEENFKLRKDIRQLSMQLDDYQLKQQIQSVKKKPAVQVVKKPTADKATQKTWNPEPANVERKEKDVYKPIKDKEMADGLLMKTIDQLTAQPIPEEKPEEVAPPVEQKTEEVTEEQTPAVNEEQKPAVEEEDTVEMPLVSSSSDLFYRHGLEGSGSEDEFDTELNSIANQQQIFSINENMPHIVHEPLKINTKKPKIILPVAEKTKEKVRQSHKRHITQMSANLSQIHPEELDITIGNAVQGKRQVTGPSRQIKPTTNLSDVTAAVIAATTKPRPDGGIPVITSTIKMPVSMAAQQLINPTPSNLSQTIDTQKSTQNVPPYVAIDKTLESSPPVPIRITLVKHPDKKDEAKEAQKEKGPIVIVPPPLQRTAEDPVAIEIRGTQIQQEKNNREVQAAMRLVGKLREQVKRLSDQNEDCEKTIVELRQKISDLTLQLHRAKLEVIKANDEKKRTQIRADNIKNRLEICYKEMSTRDDEIVRLKRDNMLLRSVAQPINEAATRINHAQREKERLQREKKHRDHVKAVTKAALASVTNPETAKHLETLLANTENSMARIEAKRRMWMEIERKNTMSVLSAMSLLSTSEVQTVKNILPEYSPFNTRRTNIPRASTAYTASAGDDVIVTQDTLPEALRKPMTYTQKIIAMDKVVPPLTPEERRDVVLRKESPELLSRLMSAMSSTPDPTLKEEKIEPTK